MSTAGNFSIFVLSVCPAEMLFTPAFFTVRYIYIGGGPTGVEFAAELHDLLHAEVEEHYPNLAKMAKISLYDVAPQILGSFDSSLIR